MVFRAVVFEPYVDLSYLSLASPILLLLIASPPARVDISCEVKRVSKRFKLMAVSNTQQFPTMMCWAISGLLTVSQSCGSEGYNFGNGVWHALKKCTPLWREAHFEVKMYKTHHSRTTFRSWDVEKVHAVVARSTFPSQNVQNTSASDHF